MVAGQSCIAGPSVFPPRATLDRPAHHTFLMPAHAQKTAADSACGGEGLGPLMRASPYAECQECLRGRAQAAPTLLSSNLPILL